MLIIAIQPLGGLLCGTAGYVADYNTIALVQVLAAVLLMQLPAKPGLAVDRVHLPAPGVT